MAVQSNGQKFEKFKITIQCNEHNFEKHSNFLRKKCYKVVFRVTVYKTSVIQFPKFGIANSIRRPKKWKLNENQKNEIQ